MGVKHGLYIHGTSHTDLKVQSLRGKYCHVAILPSFVLVSDPTKKFSPCPHHYYHHYQMSTPANETIVERWARVLLEWENRLRAEAEVVEREEQELRELEEAEVEEKQKEEEWRLAEEVEKKEREEKERREKEEREKVEAEKKKKKKEVEVKRKEEEERKKAEVEEEEEEEEGRGLLVEKWMVVTKRMREEGLRESQEGAWKGESSKTWG